MIRYQDLKICLLGIDLDQFVTNLEAVLPTYWCREKSKESGLQNFSDKKMFCFQRTKGDGIDSSLWIAEKSHDTLYVSNIVPTQKNQLSIKEYNSILNDFKSAGIEKLADQSKFRIEQTSAVYSIDDLVSKNAAKALSEFSTGANKSTGSAHPSDRNRWIKFLSLVSDDGSELSAEDLMKYFVEEGWSEDFASELAIEYELANDLLTYYKAHNVS
jgi:hypothetical protein